MLLFLYCLRYNRITKQTVTDVIGEYLKIFPLSLEYSPRLSASENIPNFGEIILNIHLIVSNYLYSRPIVIVKKILYVYRYTHYIFKKTFLSACIIVISFARWQE